MSRSDEEASEVPEPRRSGGDALRLTASPLLLMSVDVSVRVKLLLMLPSAGGEVRKGCGGASNDDEEVLSMCRA